MTDTQNKNADQKPVADKPEVEVKAEAAKADSKDAK